jgi:hypothetical protein
MYDWMPLVSPFYIVVQGSNTRGFVLLVNAILYPRGWGYVAAYHQHKMERQLWSLILEKTGIMASERTRLMKMMEIICARRTGQDA